MPGEIITGMQNVWNKGKEWLGSVHSSSVSEPLIAGDFFTSKMNFDCTFKEGGRQKIKEVGVYKFKDGKNYQ
ncbi:hypothetical protein N7U66_05840 [Lacinutrix neustonica]|uniref:SnoaL-like domain-containing protein n=1 Tax=Lacinutrix neustonica TaxID=2980107 RepID=A0A9E8SE43_9FLAO|nr:SnoaL-like domain-containing protein [Lacinutrix neustonica]WAC03138.1 hypothetical protein N7U66_05840 [Lacinutrix neustonica]